MTQIKALKTRVFIFCKINVIFVISMVDLMGIDVYSAIFIMVKF